MIPRDILKNIGQFEIRTNRLVTEFAGEARASARFTVRTTAASKTNPALNPIRTLKRRQRRGPKLHALQMTASIPRGLCPPAQGCEARATLGNSREIRQRQRRCGGGSRADTTPLGLKFPIQVSQGSSCLATLGSGPESLWDSLMAAISARTSSRITHHASRFP
jgi:hypothetical protein